MSPSSRAWSAPAALGPFTSSDCDSCALVGDCLPLNAMAWTETSKLPRTLTSLTPGERILCFDNVAERLTYTPIASLEETHNTRWVKVSLVDGSTMEMTVDHPVAVSPVQSDKRHSRFNGSCVRAGDLDVEKDCLMTLRMVWTPISEIHHFSSTPGHEVKSAETDASPRFATTSSATVTVEQPQRHEIFVMTPDKNGNSGQPIAVGSSNRAVGRAPKWAIKNTFMHVQDIDRPVLKRSNSEPSLGLCMRKQEPTQPNEQRHGNEREVWSKSSLTGSSSVSASANSADSESISALVKVAHYPFDDQSNVASLADLMCLKSKGLSSFGSQHPLGKCESACSFHFTGLLRPGKQTCKVGALCEFCHESDHHPNIRSKLRKLSQRTPMPNRGKYATSKVQL